MHSVGILVKIDWPLTTKCMGTAQMYGIWSIHASTPLHWQWTQQLTTCFDDLLVQLHTNRPTWSPHIMYKENVVSSIHRHNRRRVAQTSSCFQVCKTSDESYGYRCNEQAGKTAPEWCCERTEAFPVKRKHFPYFSVKLANFNNLGLRTDTTPLCYAKSAASEYN